MKTFLAVTLAAALCSGCIGISVSRRPSPSPEPCNQAVEGKYTNIIKESRTLPFTDRATLLIGIARKSDLTQADRDLLAHEAQTLPFTDRTKLLNVLAGVE